jgi:cytochrome P450 family 628
MRLCAHWYVFFHSSVSQVLLLDTKTKCLLIIIGPTEISISDPTAVKSIFSAQSQVLKGPWYTVLEPRVTLQMTRDKQDHSRRRRVWDQGFSSRALRDYEPRVSRYTDQLIQAINRGIGLGKPMDVLRWFNYYSFDVMNDLSLGSLLVCLLRGGMGMF